MSGLSLVLACLRALDIEEITVGLDGSGDSGDTTLESCVMRTGERRYALPPLTVAMPYVGQVVSLEDLVGDVAAELPDGNWVDIEGGYGTVTFLPFEEDPGDQVSVDMTYRDGYDDEPDFEDDDEAEPVFEQEIGDLPLPIITAHAGGMP